MNNKKYDYEMHKTFVLASILVLFIMIFCAIVTDLGRDNTQKCIYRGCNSKRRSGSGYCSIHIPSESNYISSSYNKNSSTSSKKNSYSNNRSSSSSNKSYSSQRLYDVGYNSIYDDDDYDWNRYQRDSDYADGVDDAMDELDW